MRKKYISILELLSQTTEWLKEKNNQIHFNAWSYATTNAMEKLPVEFISESCVNEEDVVKMRRISIPLDKTRSMEMYMPEFLEMEMLRNSDFHYTEAELACLEQLMIWQVRQWCYVKDDFTMQHFITLLDEHELLYEIDLDERWENAFDIVNNIYREKFQVFALSSHAYIQKNVNHYIAAPMSTLDAMKIMDTCTGEHTVYYARYLLHAPLIAVFSILERHTVEYERLTLHEYRAYFNCVRDDIVPMLQTELDEIKSYNFSYGFIRVPDRTHLESDKWLIAKTIGQLLRHMKKHAVDKNIAIVQAHSMSLRNLSHSNVKRVHILLNNSDLSWDTHEESQDY